MKVPKNRCKVVSDETQRCKQLVPTEEKGISRTIGTTTKPRETFWGERGMNNIRTSKRGEGQRGD